MSRRRSAVLLALPLALVGSGLTGLLGLPPGASAAGRHLVAFGDSVPAGATCPCPNEVTLLGQRLSTRQGATIGVSNLARNGATTATVQGQVRSGAMGDPAGRVTTLTIGANDFDPSIVSSPSCANAACYRSQLHTTDGRIRTILDTLLANQDRRVDSTDPIVVTGYWNVFADGAVGRRHGAAYVRNSDALTRALNTILAHDAALYGVRYVDLYRAFKGDGSRDDTNLLGPDGDHPNAAGHRVIAATVNAAIPSAPAPSASPTPTVTSSTTGTPSPGASS